MVAQSLAPRTTSARLVRPGVSCFRRRCAGWCGRPGSGLSAGPFQLGERCARLGGDASGAAPECGRQRHPPPGWQVLPPDDVDVHLAFTSPTKAGVARDRASHRSSDPQILGFCRQVVRRAYPPYAAFRSRYTTENRRLTRDLPRRPLRAPWSCFATNVYTRHLGAPIVSSFTLADLRSVTQRRPTAQAPSLFRPF
jgi:hypothetical protein